jgi:hypothetical protein
MPEFDIKKSSEDKLLEDLKGRFTHAFNAHKRWIKEKNEWERFYDGDQWKQEELKELEDRNQPPVVINRIKPKIDSIIGMELGVPVDTKVFARGSLDFESAKHMTEALRYVEYHTGFDSKENDAFEDQLISGKSWYKVGIKWDGFEPEITTELVQNDVYEDPFSKQDDLSDAKYIHETVWVDIEDAKQLFPKHKKALEDAMVARKSMDELLDEHVSTHPDQYRKPEEFVGENEMFVDKERKRVRLVSTWYRTPVLKRYLWNPVMGVENITDWKSADIKKAKQTYPDSQEFTEIKHKLNVAIYTWNRVLEKKLDIKPWDEDAKFDHVMVRGYKYKQKKKRGMHYGLVKQMVDPQKEVNKRRSKTLHLLNTNKMLFEDGAFANPTDARQEWAKPDSWIPINPNFRTFPEKNIDLAQSQFLLLQEAKREIDSVGVRGEIEGQSKATSGRDFQLRHESAVQMLRKLFRNLRDGRRRVGLLWIDYIQLLWREEKAIRITDDPESSVIVDPETGKVVTINAVDGKYDLIVEEAPETLNLQSEQFDKMVQMVGAGVPIPPDMLIEASAMPNKKKILERFEQQQQAQAQVAQAAAEQPPQ